MAKVSLSNGQIITMPDTVPATLPTDFSSYYGVSPFTTTAADHKNVSRQNNLFGGYEPAPRNDPTLGSWVGYDSKSDQDTYAKLKSPQQFQQEVQGARNAKVATGKSAIDTDFVPFDDSFFTTKQNDAMQGGVKSLNTSYGSLFRADPNQDRAFTDTANADYWNAYNALNSQATDATNAFKNDVAGAKNNLYKQNDALNGDATVAANASDLASNLKQRNLSISPIGQVFQNLMTRSA